MTTYDTSRIEVLTGLDTVRKRPGMYVGSTGERGLHHLLFEALEPAADAVLQGRASIIHVTLQADGSARVAHDGPPENDLTESLTKVWGPARPTGRIRVSPIAAGCYVVNALSEQLLVEERRDGVTVRHAYACGEQLVPPTEVGPADDTGTVLTFRPDSGIFETVPFSYRTLADRFRELAFLNRSLEIVLTDERGSGTRTERFRAPGGTADFTAFLGGDPSDTLATGRTDERMRGTLEVAVSWTGRGGLHCFANSRRTEDGTHRSGLRAGLRAALLPRAGKRALRAVFAELTAVVSVKLDDPDYQGCTRRWLANRPVHACVAEAVQHAVESWLDEHPQRAAQLTDA